jgi:hypothetical protein
MSANRKLWEPFVRTLQSFPPEVLPTFRRIFVDEHSIIELCPRMAEMVVHLVDGVIAFNAAAGKYDLLLPTFENFQDGELAKALGASQRFLDTAAHELVQQAAIDLHRITTMEAAYRLTLRALPLNN